MNIHLIYFSPGGTTRKTIRNIAEGIISSSTNITEGTNTTNTNITEGTNTTNTNIAQGRNSTNTNITQGRNSTNTNITQGRNPASRNIAEGTNSVSINEIDMTIKENREKQYSFTKDDLVILGMMTATKIFGPFRDIINCLHGDNTPLVGVIMYGNGYYGSSLKQMKREVEPQGFNMVGAGTFIGQHPFNKKIAENRPDTKDRQIQLDFGEKIYNKIIKNRDFSFKAKLKTDWPPNDIKGKIKCALILTISGNGNNTIPASMNKMVFTDKCIECGLCERNCPTGAISMRTRSFDFTKCYGCFSCGSNCPAGAIKQTNKTITKAVENAYEKRKKRREPQLFF